jgi:hypothetical protein
VNRDSKDHPEIEVPKVVRVHPVLQGHKVIKEQEGLKVLEDHKVIKEIQESRDLQVLEVR